MERNAELGIMQSVFSSAARRTEVGRRRSLNAAAVS